MHIRKRSFFEITFPLAVVFFICIGTSFLDAMGDSRLRWIFLAIVFLYLFLNKKLLSCINYPWKILLFVYLIWCISTTLWSEVPILSLVKSTFFAVDIVVMLSAGSLWVIKYDYDRSFHWLFLVLVVVWLSGFLGGASEGSLDSFGSFNLYQGLTDNANAFGFTVAIISPLIFLKLYQHKANRWPFLAWFVILLVNIHFLFLSFSRSSIAIFLCIASFFVLSLPLSKKILMAFSLFFGISLMLLMLPASYLKTEVTAHIVKFNGDIIDPNAPLVFQSRSLVWKKSIEQAKKGGIVGGGFAVTIGDKNFSINNLSGVGYGREKGNSQFEIMEETGIIGLILYGLILISFFVHVIPYYRRITGHDKVAMGLALGAIVGLLVESIVEGWWDSAAGPEVICFWTLVGSVYGMIYLQKKRTLT